MTARFFRLGLMLVAVVALAFVFAPKTVFADACNATATGNWNTSGTWSCGHVPTSSDDVTITGATVTVTIDSGLSAVAQSVTLGNATNNTTTLTFADSTSSLTVGGDVTITGPTAGATRDLQVNAGTLTVNGNMSLGTGQTGNQSNRVTKVTITTGTVTVKGGLTYNNISGSSALQTQIVMSGGAGTFNLEGTFTVNNSSGTLTPGTTSTFVYSGTGSQTIVAVSSITYNNLSTSGGGTKTAGAALPIAGNLTIGSGTTFDPAGFTHTIQGGKSAIVNGTLDFSNANGEIRSGTTGTSTLTMDSAGLIKTIDPNGLGPATNASFSTQTGGAWDFSSVSTSGTVEYYRSATSGQAVTDRDYNNLTISGATQTKTWTLGATRTVNGNFTINSSAPLTLVNAQTVNVKGNWTNDSSATVNLGTSTVGFTGTGAQTVGGTNSTTFNNLTINNSGGTVTLNTAGTVSALLTLTSDLTANQRLIQSGTCSGDGDVVGTVSRSDQGTSAKCFGNSLNTITFASGGGIPSGTVYVNLTKSAPGGFSGSVVQRYYTITSNSWTGSGTTLQLRYKTGELSGITESTLVLYKYPNGGTKYIEQGGTVNTSSHYVNLTGVSSFSDWAFAAAGTPTSAGLVSFKARLTPKNKVKVKWETGNELDVLGFNLYRQTVGNKKWVKVNGDIPIDAQSIGNPEGALYKLTDKKVQSGKAYRYKLEVLKTSGPSEWSEVVQVTIP